MISKGFGSAAESNVDPRRVVSLAANPSAYDVSQPRTRIEVDVLLLQHDPHPHGRIVRRIEAGLDLP